MTDTTAERTEALVVERDGGVLRITINRPHRMNAIDLDTMRTLADLVETGSHDRDVRVIVLAGAEGSFSTGADLAAASAGPAADPRVVMDTANRMIRAVLTAPVPVIAEVDGAAAGVGASIALAADLSYLSPRSYLLLAFVNIGLMPDGGASMLIPASMGRARAAEMALLGERLPAADAVAAGLVTRLVPADELRTHVDTVAARLASGPRRALELTKRSITAATLARVEEAFALEAEGQIELLGSADFAEGSAAMLQRRKPNFGA